MGEVNTSANLADRSDDNRSSLGLLAGLLTGSGLLIVLLLILL